MRTPKQRDLIMRLAEIEASLCEMSESGWNIDFSFLDDEDKYESRHLMTLVSRASAVVVVCSADVHGEHYFEWGLQSRFPHAHATMDYNNYRSQDSVSLAREFADAFGLEFLKPRCVCVGCVGARVRGEVE